MHSPHEAPRSIPCLDASRHRLSSDLFDVIETVVQPTQEPAVYDDLAGAIQDLKSGAIDGVVVDLPTAFIVIAVQVPKGVIVGQFPTVGPQEYFAMAFEKGSPLVQCVNLALQEMKDDGTLAELYQKYFKTDPPESVLTGKTTAQ